MQADQSNKTHRKKHSGPKAKRKFQKSLDPTSVNDKRNPKAFAIQSVNKAARLFRRGKDIETKKQHVPKIESIGAEPPPLIVSVIGPPKVGKSTLIRCLIKNFTRQNITYIKGPITIVAGKSRRITFIECSNDLCSMIDLAKISDLALLLIDASFGFEMEIFEFINICQVHGFPKIMGVLTHLDSFKNISTLRKTKKRLKQRFWTEVYPGAKLFYLSGLVKEEYQKVEIRNLGRFIIVMKTNNIEWRNTHPYILVDRIEDITDPQMIQSCFKVDRKVCFYGYVHGSSLKFNSDIHLIGVGDYTLDTIRFLEDPCPLPETIKKRSLNEKERVVYAPMSGIGGLIYDKDAIYIELGGSHSHRHNKGDNFDDKHQQDQDEDINPKIYSNVPIEDTIKNTELTLFSESQPLKSSQITKNFYESLDITNKWENMEESELKKATLINSEVVTEELSSHTLKVDSHYMEDMEISGKGLVYEDAEYMNVKNDDSLTSDIKWKSLLEQKSDRGYWSGLHGDVGGQRHIDDDIASLRRSLCGPFDIDIQSMVLRTNNPKLGSLFSVTKKNDAPTPESLDGYDCSKVSVYKEFHTNANVEDSPHFVGLIDWSLPQNKVLLNSRFMKITQTLDEEKLNGRNKKTREYDSCEDNYSNGTDAQEEPQSNGSDDGDSEPSNGESDGDNKSNVCSDDEKDESNVGENIVKTKETKSNPNSKKGRESKRMKEMMERKKKLKARFDKGYDEDKLTFYDELRQGCEEQSQLNKSEFVELEEEIRVKYEGHRPGMYVRIEIGGIPAEFIEHHDPSYPIIIGGIAPTECSNGYIQARIKKHRWFERILKTRDPLIMSVGWRRYQTVIVYSNEDHSGRNHMLKYTPQNLHCLANFYGPICPQNSGILGIQSLAEGVKNFRISMTGVILNLNKSLDIVKKLKIVGTPLKIFKKTAFIKGMFNTALEAAKFEGAAIKTVSGIRGQIKRALHNPVGAVRVTFEDQILMSDIVFLKTWTSVDVPKYYNSVCNLLLPRGPARHSWTGMRTVGQIRQGQKPPTKSDSLYKKINRPPQRETPLIIPPQLEKTLPFAEKAKKDRVGIKFIRKRDDLSKPDNATKVAVIEDANERKINQLLKVAKFVYEQKRVKNIEAMKERVDKHRKELARIQEKRDVGAKRFKKRICRTLGLVKQKE